MPACTPSELYYLISRCLADANPTGIGFRSAVYATTAGPMLELASNNYNSSELLVRVHLGVVMGDTADSYVSYDYIYKVSPTAVVGTANRAFGPNGGRENEVFPADAQSALDKLVETLFDPTCNPAPWVSIREAIDLAGWDNEQGSTIPSGSTKQTAAKHAHQRLVTDAQHWGMHFSEETGDPKGLHHYICRYTDALDRSCYLEVDTDTLVVRLRVALACEPTDSTNSVTYSDLFVLYPDGKLEARKLRTESGCFHSDTQEQPLKVTADELLRRLDLDLKPQYRNPRNEIRTPRVANAAKVAGWKSLPPVEGSSLG